MFINKRPEFVLRIDKFRITVRSSEDINCNKSRQRKNFLLVMCFNVTIKREKRENHHELKESHNFTYWYK